MPTISVYDEEMLSEIMVKDFSTFTNRLVSYFHIFTKSVILNITVQ